MGLKDNLKLLYRRSVRAINQSSSYKKIPEWIGIIWKKMGENNNETYLNMIEAFVLRRKSNQEFI